MSASFSGQLILQPRLKAPPSCMHPRTCHSSVVSCKANHRRKGAGSQMQQVPRYTAGTPEDHIHLEVHLSLHCLVRYASTPQYHPKSPPVGRPVSAPMCWKLFVEVPRRSWQRPGHSGLWNSFRLVDFVCSASSSLSVPSTMPPGRASACLCHG